MGTSDVIHAVVHASIKLDFMDVSGVRLFPGELSIIEHCILFIRINRYLLLVKQFK